MKILYIDVRSLLYSKSYLDSNEEVKKAHAATRITNDASEFMSLVKPDLATAAKLEQVATEINAKIYPLGNYYSRKALIENSVFKELSVADDIPVSFQRPDDRDELRLLTQHAHQSDADFLIIGEIAAPQRLDNYPDRYIATTPEVGLSEHMLRRIRNF